MVVKSSREYLFMVASLFLCIITFFFVFVSIGDGILFPCIVAVGLLLIVLRFWISAGRTLNFDDSGCTVSFLCFKKHYPWETLRTKRVEDYKNAVGYRDPYAQGVLFCSKKVATPLKLKPSQYSFFFHPFCFFFVNFKLTIEYGKWVNVMRRLYEVDKDTFLEHFSQHLD